MADERTPGYFQAKKTGAFLNVNPMSHTKYTLEKDVAGSTIWNRTRISDGFNLGSYEWNGNQAAAYWWTKSTSPFPAWSGGIPTWATDSSVSTSALANGRGQGMDLLTFVVELHKTIDMIVSFRNRTLKRAERVADRLKQVPKRTGNSFNGYDAGHTDYSSAFAETWLEARYGWRTLALDIGDIQTAIYKLQNARTTHLVRGYATVANALSRTLGSVTAIGTVLQRVNGVEVGGKYGWGTATMSQTLTYKKRSGTILEAIVSDIFTVDPLVTLYEVIPFSMIADWFSNLGEMVQAYSPFATENVLGTWISSHEELLTTCTTVTAAKVDTPNNENNTIKSGGGASSTLETLKVVTNRYPYTLTGLNLTFKMNLNASRLTDLASIFFGRYHGILKGLSKSTRV